MYTLRPLLSWQYFTQASILYQLYMKSTHRLASDISLLGQIPVEHMNIPDGKQRRLEESMYWSCFKSESEFRVELPLPQSELATYYHPQMFPSPPSPANVEKEKEESAEAELNHSPLVEPNGVTNTSPYASEAASLREHARQLCNEEESWYYYLTEIALRRIGNRIINTFFRQEPTSWLNIKPWLPIALEFDVSDLCRRIIGSSRQVPNVSLDSGFRMVSASARRNAALGDELHDQSAKSGNIA